MVDLSVDIAGLRLKNPIMPASGTFSEELADVFDLDLLGAHVTQTITRGKRAGNPTPRVCEVDGSMLNSIGIPSKGVEAFLAKVVPFYRAYQAPLVVSISGNTADEFATLCSEVTVEGVAALEVVVAAGLVPAPRDPVTRSVVAQLLVRGVALDEPAHERQAEERAEDGGGHQKPRDRASCLKYSGPALYRSKTRASFW